MRFHLLQNGNSANRTPTSLLVFALFFPLVLTFVYFVVLQDFAASVQKTAYSIGKIIQFALPVVWIAFVRKERWLARMFNKRGVLEGVLFGITTAIVIFGAFIFITVGAFHYDSSVFDAVSAKLRGLGIGDKRLFLLVGLFYSLVHSGLEEYYWRWFVYRQLDCPAILSSIGFTLHHIVILGTYFGYSSPLCWIASLGVFVGGLYWCWLYQRTDNIYGAWIGHGLVDASIFFVGFSILTG